MAWRALDELPAKTFVDWKLQIAQGGVASYHDPRTGRLMVWEFSDRTEIHSWARRERIKKIPKHGIEHLEQMLASQVS